MSTCSKWFRVEKFLGLPSTCSKRAMPQSLLRIANSSSKFVLYFDWSLTNVATTKTWWCYDDRGYPHMHTWPFCYFNTSQKYLHRCCEAIDAIVVASPAIPSQVDNEESSPPLQKIRRRMKEQKDQKESTPSHDRREVARKKKHNLKIPQAKKWCDTYNLSIAVALQVTRRLAIVVLWQNVTLLGTIWLGLQVQKRYCTRFACFRNCFQRVFLKDAENFQRRKLRAACVCLLLHCLWAIIPFAYRVLLHGPPGTGKTSVAKAVAAQMHWPLLEINPASLLSKWTGESEKTLVNMFESAKVRCNILWYA